MKERFFYLCNRKKAREALEKIYAFNEGKLKKRDIASDLLVAEAKKYKGRKPKIRKMRSLTLIIVMVFRFPKKICCG